jgi:outer membrane protein W
MIKFAISSTLMIASVASAETEVGLSLLGQSKSKVGCVAGAKCESSTGGSKLYVDTLINPSFGLGAIAYTSQEQSGGYQKNTGGVAAGKGKAQGVAATVFIPFTYDDFTFKARAGLGYAKGKVSYLDGSSSSKTSVVPVFGAGVSYAINKNWSINADLDRLPVKYNDKEKANIDFFTVGGAYHF